MTLAGLAGSKRLAGSLILAGLAVAGCGQRGGDGLGTYQGAPIVVISIDTLRSDRLPAYGYGGVETPAIDALRRDGILYERAYSHTPLTLPSHTSMLTGQLPGHHGVRDNVGYLFDSAAHPYLPRLLGAAGYRTGAAVSSYVLRGETGLAAGFDHYEAAIDLRTSEALGRSQRSGRETSALALEWLGAGKGENGGKPPFLLLHLYEPHTPYEPEKEMAARFPNPYDGEVATADAIVGDFLARLKEMDLYDDAVVLLLSDHGEGLGDHGEQEHGIFLYREALQVPMILKLPGKRHAGAAVASPVALVDVLPTLLALAGAAVPQGLDGVPLPATDGPQVSARAIYSETFYPRLHLGWSELSSMIRDRFHYIEGPDPELFDLVADRAERKNVLATERRAYAALREELQRYERPLAAPSEVDAETAAKLAALGYLGGAAAPAEGELPDPKTRIRSLADFGAAMQKVGEQQFAAAVPELERLVAENPRMADAWEALGRSLHRLGRPEAALAAYEKAMEVTGGAGHVALGTATVLLAVGRLDEAKAHAELALKTSPTAGHNLLSQIALARNDLATAEKEARLALAAKGSRVGSLVALAEVLQKQGKTGEALAATGEAMAELAKATGDPRGFEGLRAVRGDLLARLGRDGEAEQLFREEIERFPAHIKAYSHLATLYASQGRPTEAIATLRRMVDTNASPAAYGEAVRTLRVLGESAGAAALLRHAMSLYPESKELRQLAG